jgi:antitoxin component YwqK of YwqJK toxin-antitoxin module
MKSIGIILLLCFISHGSFAQADSGFTNKAEAKNLTVNGLKEGKWVEYISFNDKLATDSNCLCDSYRLTIYVGGKPSGIVRQYNITGELSSIVYYARGKKKGKLKEFYGNGKLSREINYTNDMENGLERRYYENGILRSVFPFTYGGVNGIAKTYYEDGKLKSEITYKNSEPITIKNYDENGNEIK